MRLRERLLVFLGVCLPVPVLAATGLSVPLPGPVERMAAELVPFADTVALTDSPRQVEGSIVLTEAERRRSTVGGKRPRSIARTTRPAPPEQSARSGAEHRSAAVPVREEPDARRSSPPRQRQPHPPLPPVPTAPAEEAPGHGSEKPKPPREPERRPDHKPKPKPRAPKPKPPKPKEQKPKAPKAPKPRPDAPSERETSVEKGGRPSEEDKGPRGGNPEQTAPQSRSPHGS